MNRKLLSGLLFTGTIVLFGCYWAGSTGSAAMTTAADRPTAEITVVTEEHAFDSNPFAAYASYRAECSDRYAQYRLAMPELDVETVLWHVNSGLDMPSHIQVSEAASHDPLVVNRRYKLPDDFEPAELETIHSGILATPGTAEAFQRMRAAAMRDGVFIEAAAGYRSLRAQAERFEAKKLSEGEEAAEMTVARPGHEEHSTGRALHIVDRNYTFDGFDNTPEYAWLIENCADYGFILRYGRDSSEITGFDFEPYHFTFVGKEIALGMKAAQIATLEEYAARGLAPPDDMPIDDRTAVVIVAGSGGVGDNTYESVLALRIKEYLQREDLRVVITQGADEPGANVRIGLQTTSADSDTVACFASDSPESRSLAETVCGRLCWSGLVTERRSVGQGAEEVLTYLDETPSILLEIPAAGRTGGTECDDVIAKSIADAVIAHLGIRKMYLTFDDGPSAKNTPKVLEILRQKNVKATFFVIGEMAEANPDLLRQIVAEGHAIGIHSYSHDYHRLYSSVESFTEDFFRAREVVTEITGLEPVIYRFPGGSINHYNKAVYQDIIHTMNQLDFVYFDWNISSEDALGGVQPGELMNNIRGCPRYHHAVLLMHDAYSNIAEELSDIIDYYSDYQIDVIENGTRPVQF